jgi:hypothetical protein
MVVEERQEPASGADPPRFDRARDTRLRLSGAILGSVFLGYGVPFFGIVLSLAVPIAMHIGRCELWDAAVDRGHSSRSGLRRPFTPASSSRLLTVTSL